MKLQKKISLGYNVTDNLKRIYVCSLNTSKLIMYRYENSSHLIVAAY